MSFSKQEILMPMPRKKEPRKFCSTCGIVLIRKTFSGRLEDLSAFHRRKFCSLTCANTRSKPLTKHGYSYRARKHLKHHCEACGHEKSLQAHHVDQNRANNNQENMQTLCKHCHDLWHKTQERRGGTIAGRMPQLF